MTVAASAAPSMGGSAAEKPSPAIRLIAGDCVERMEALYEEGVRVDAVVTDPPYHLASIVDRLGSPDAAPIQSGVTGVYARSSSGFMGQKWDGGDVAFQPRTWRAVFNLMRPGAHLVAFSGTRTYHRMACAIEDAAFEIRDQLAWMYGTGFPKSHNLDGEWDGWGTALKPAWEPIVLARKPMIGSVADNVGVFGTGAINIDACRIRHGETLRAGSSVIPCRHDPAAPRGRSGEASAARRYSEVGSTNFAATPGPRGGDIKGRWPANIVHDGSDEVHDAFAAYGQRGAAAPASGPTFVGMQTSVAMNARAGMGSRSAAFHGDSGTAARFFYSAKATAEDRAGSTHPTVKPVSLMRWLVRMITPPGGLVLDCFAGTGTTGAAARAEGVSALLIEREDEYLADIRRRLRLAIDDAPVSGRPIAMDLGPLFGDRS